MATGCVEERESGAQSKLYHANLRFLNAFLKPYYRSTVNPTRPTDVIQNPVWMNIFRFDRTVLSGIVIELSILGVLMYFSMYRIEFEFVNPNSTAGHELLPRWESIGLNPSHWCGAGLWTTHHDPSWTTGLPSLLNGPSHVCRLPHNVFLHR